MAIIDEMLALFVQNPGEKQIKGYLRHLEDIPTDTLRAAVAGCIECGQRGKPTVAEIRRRVAEAGARRMDFSHEHDEKPRYVECRKRLHRTAFGNLICCKPRGHEGDCRTWFDHRGPQPGDDLIIRGLLEKSERVNRRKAAGGFRRLIDGEAIL